MTFCNTVFVRDLSWYLWSVLPRHTFLSNVQNAHWKLTVYLWMQLVKVDSRVIISRFLKFGQSAWPYCERGELSAPSLLPRHRELQPPFEKNIVDLLHSQCKGELWYLRSWLRRKEGWSSCSKCRRDDQALVAPTSHFPWSEKQRHSSALTCFPSSYSAQCGFKALSLRILLQCVP